MKLGPTAFQLLWGGVFVGASWMAAQSASVGSSSASDPFATNGQAEAETRTAKHDLACVLDEADYPPERYRRFPLDVRALIQRADLESGYCRGCSGNEPETLRACNRSHAVLLELRRRGWCWGGAETNADRYWLPCSDDPNHRPLNPEPPFSEEEIEERMTLDSTKKPDER